MLASLHADIPTVYPTIQQPLPSALCILESKKKKKNFLPPKNRPRRQTATFNNRLNHNRLLAAELCIALLLDHLRDCRRFRGPRSLIRWQLLVFK